MFDSGHLGPWEQGPRLIRSGGSSFFGGRLCLFLLRSPLSGASSNNGIGVQNQVAQSV